MIFVVEYKFFLFFSGNFWNPAINHRRPASEPKLSAARKKEKANRIMLCSVVFIDFVLDSGYDQDLVAKTKNGLKQTKESGDFNTL